tara:strand:- start:7202 stop:7489 length:288 start_codon:yes stop_codon:yes gene_type:complete
MDNNFSLYDFKKWMDNQKDEQSPRPRSKFIGTWVESKLRAKKLVIKIDAQEGEPKDLVEDFMESGGRIIDVDGLSFLVEVESGNFYVPRLFVKRA